MTFRLKAVAAIAGEREFGPKGDPAVHTLLPQKQNVLPAVN